MEQKCHVAAKEGRCSVKQSAQVHGTEEIYNRKGKPVDGSNPHKCMEQKSISHPRSPLRLEAIRTSAWNRRYQKATDGNGGDVKQSAQVHGTEGQEHCLLRRVGWKQSAQVHGTEDLAMLRSHAVVVEAIRTSAWNRRL